MAQQYPRDPWYDQKPHHAPAAEPAQEGGRPPRKRRTGWKIAGVALGVLVLIAASVYVFTDQVHVRFSRQEELPAPSAPPFSDGESSGRDGFADDFRDFFSSYYTPVSTPAPDSMLAREEGAAGFRLTLHDARGLETMSLQELYPACVESVVGIRANRVGRGYFWGSGFIVSSDGYILTNQHIISGAKLATVVLADGRELPARLVGEDARMDIAVLKIDARDLPAATLGDSSSLAVGDEVAAIGNPLGASLTGTLTNGIISAIDRSISYNGNKLTLLQTNTAINEGNSGGPLFNMYGQVVGITNMKMSAAYTEVSIEGIGFAIPTTVVKAVADQLIANGKYSQPGLGVTLGAIPEEAAEHYDLPEGLYVYEIAEGSSAKEQGLLVGDVVTHVNGSPVRSTDDVLAIRDAMAVGDSMELTVFREGQVMVITVELRELSQLY